MAKKWIINKNSDRTRYDFRIGNVEFHRELAEREIENVIGGGHWHLDKENKILYLYGKSEDFGRISIEQLRDAKQNAFYSPRLEDFKWIFSDSDWLDDCLEKGIEV
jgi:hypothetical protein